MNKIIKITRRQADAVEKELRKSEDLLHKAITPISDLEGFVRCKHMNFGNPPERVYKYLPLDSAMLCLENGNIRFSQPSSWRDEYEGRFYSGKNDYSKILSEEAKSVLSPKLYACCSTQNVTSESAWKVYSYNDCNNGKQNNVCVQITIDVLQFRLMLEKYACDNNCMVYEGPMIYNYSDNEIMNIDNVDSKYYNLFFSNFKLDNYLSLLRIKRAAFYYENEYRFFVIPQNQDTVKEDHLDVPINWEGVIKEIKIESRNEDKIKRDFMVFLNNHGVTTPLQEFDLYKMDINNC